MLFDVEPVGVHENVYPGVAPVGVTLAEPSHAPKHETMVDVPFGCNAEGCVIVDVCVRVQPFWSVTVKVYDPAH